MAEGGKAKNSVKIQSEIQSNQNAGGQKLQQREISSPDDYVKILNISVEDQLSKIVEHSDPISPATAVPTDDSIALSDDESTPKVILNLEANFTDKSTDSLLADSDDINKAALNQLEQLSQKRGKPKISGSDHIAKTVKKLQNRALLNSNELITEIFVGSQKPKKILNPLISSSTDDDLVAILEGKDDEDSDAAHYEVVKIVPSSEFQSEPDASTTILSKEEERQIALEQMSSIPSSSRGRKRKGKDDIGQTNIESVNVISSSVSPDRNDNQKPVIIKRAARESKVQSNKDSSEKKVLIASKIEPFKRTRPIKKKIIWDPDAPETQVSYASLIQSSAKKTPPPNKRIAMYKKIEQTLIAPKVSASQKTRSQSITPTLLNNKKKKLTEIDKLLGDEGAANMLSSLEADKSERDTKTKKGISQNVEKQIKKEILPKKRGTKPKSAAASWDYVYNQRNDDSMIVRRRSNSSYSSSSPRRLSTDQTPTHKTNPCSVNLSPEVTKVKTNSANEKTFEFIKPEAKKSKIEEVHSAGSEIILELKDPIRKSNRNNAVNVASEMKGCALAKSDEVVLKKHGNVTELLLCLNNNKLKNTFSVQLMNDLCQQLDLLKKDNTCKVVYITTDGEHFCQGVDFSSLTFGSLEKRKTTAAELSTAIKNLLATLASFPKPLLAGVIGSCSGLGVTMLPLFDIVISSDKSTFDTNYAKIGQLPEGYCIFNQTSTIRHNFKIKLFWLCEKLTANEAVLSGLVTKLTATAKVQDDTLTCAKKLSTFSYQTYSAMKSQRQKYEISKLLSALNEEQKSLAQQWLTAECQEKIKKYLQNETW